MGYRSVLHGWGLVAACAIAACDADFTASLGSSDRDAVPVHVEVVAPSRDVPTTLGLTGIVEAVSPRSLAFESTGRIARIHVEVGERVRAGDVIAEFDRAKLGGEVRSAHAALRRSEARRVEVVLREDRRRQLLEFAVAPAGTDANQNIERSLRAAEVRYALAMLERAETRLASAELRAPADGVVDRLYRTAGESTPAGAPVARFVELSTVALRAAAPRAVLTLIEAGGEVRVIPNHAGSGELVGEIVGVADGAGRVDARVEFEARVANPDLVLQPGMVARVEVPVAGPPADYTLPLAAVRRGIDAPAVAFVVVDHGAGARVERRTLELAGLRGDRVAVVSGLRAGDRVVTHGFDLIAVGDSVRIVGEGP